MHDPIEMQRLAAELPIERVAKRFIVSTDPDEHVDQSARYVDLGFRHLIFDDPGFDQEGFPRNYGTKILPRLRARFEHAAPSTGERLRGDMQKEGLRYPTGLSVECLVPAILARQKEARMVTCLPPAVWDAPWPLQSSSTATRP